MFGCEPPPKGHLLNGKWSPPARPLPLKPVWDSEMSSKSVKASSIPPKVYLAGEAEEPGALGQWGGPTTEVEQLHYTKGEELRLTSQVSGGPAGN